MSDPITKKVTSYVVFVFLRYPKKCSSRLLAESKSSTQADKDFSLCDASTKSGSFWKCCMNVVFYCPTSDNRWSAHHRMSGHQESIENLITNEGQVFSCPTQHPQKVERKIFEATTSSLSNDSKCSSCRTFDSSEFQDIYMECWYWCRGWKEGKGAYRLNPLRLRSASICLRRLLIC